MTDDLDGLAFFAAVAETRGFRAAGDRLGVTGSAVSQAIRKLEARVGVPLVQRTTRSVRLTAAGERLYAAVRPAMDEVRAAVTAVTEMGAAPRGALRLHVATAAETYLTGTLIAGFLRQHPGITLDLVVSDEPLDIVAEGYDGGIRLGEVIDGDMIAEPLSGDLRLMVVGSPAYFARRATPRHPRDLAEHECINWHQTANDKPYRWEFTDEQGRDFSVAVPARVLTTNPVLNVRLALAGIGLTLATEDRVRDEVARGELIPVLEKYSTPFPGFYLYYPQLRRASAPLRALVEYLRHARAGDIPAALRTRPAKRT